MAYNLVSFAVVTQVSAFALHYLKPARAVPVVKSKEQVAEGLRYEPFCIASDAGTVAGAAHG